MRSKVVLFVCGMIIVIFLVVFFLVQTKNDSYKDITYIKENGINIEEYGVMGDGITDDTENFQRAIEDAAAKKKVLIVPAKTYLLSPEKYRNPASIHAWWCLLLPSNSEIYFEDGSLLKLIDNAPEWTRVLVIDGVSNVQLYGHVEVDGSADTVLKGNEHMHGIFIFNAKDVGIESAYSYNCYGDNLFIGGTEKEYSKNVRIHYFKGVTAGRKNLVIHYVDDLYIKTAILDNSKGGVGNNWRGENSLDLEPDDYLGKKSFYQRIDYLSTYGRGNDFTVGTKKEMARKWLLDIGTFHVKVMDGVKGELLSYAITIKIHTLLMETGNQTESSILMNYASTWEIKDAYIIGGKGNAIVAKVEKNEKPELIVERLYISRPFGKGLDLWGADAKIDTLEANTVQEEVLKVFSTLDQEVHLDKLITRNSGDQEIIHVSDYDYTPNVSINELYVSDDRAKKVDYLIHLDSQIAVDRFTVKRIHSNADIKKFSFGPSVINLPDQLQHSIKE